MSFKFELDKTQTLLLTRVLDGLRQHVVEASFKPTPEGLNLSNMDSSHVVALSALLEATWFKSYEYESDLARTDYGIELKKLHQILKSVKKANTVTIFSHEDEGDPQIGIQIQQNKGKRNTYFYLDNLQVDLDINCLNSVMANNLSEYPVKLEMTTSDFKEIVDQMSILKKENASIEYNPETNRLLFRIGERSESVIEYEVENSIEDSDFHSPIKACLGVEKLIQIGKCVTLTDIMEIYLNSDYYPIYFNFPIEDAGQVLFALSPRYEDKS